MGKLFLTATGINIRLFDFINYRNYFNQEVKMLVILAGLLFFLYILPVKSRVSFTRREEKDYLILGIEALFVNQELEISYLDFKQYFGSHVQLTANLKRNSAQDIELKQELTRQELEKAANWIQEFGKLFDMLQVISLFTNKCVYFYCRTSFGLRNPAYTGFIAGSLWTVKGVLNGVVNNLFNFKSHPLIEVEPKFNIIQPVEIEVNSIFEFQLGNIISTGIKLLFLGLKRRL